MKKNIKPEVELDAEVEKRFSQVICGGHVQGINFYMFIGRNGKPIRL